MIFFEDIKLVDSERSPHAASGAYSLQTQSEQIRVVLQTMSATKTNNLLEPDFVSIHTKLKTLVDAELKMLVGKTLEEVRHLEAPKLAERSHVMVGLNTLEMLPDAHENLDSEQVWDASWKVIKTKIGSGVGSYFLYVGLADLLTNTDFAKVVVKEGPWTLCLYSLKLAKLSLLGYSLFSIDPFFKDMVFKDLMFSLYLGSREEIKRLKFKAPEDGRIAQLKEVADKARIFKRKGFNKISVGLLEIKFKFDSNPGEVIFSKTFKSADSEGQMYTGQELAILQAFMIAKLVSQPDGTCGAREIVFSRESIINLVTWWCLEKLVAESCWNRTPNLYNSMNVLLALEHISGKFDDISTAILGHKCGAMRFKIHEANFTHGGHWKASLPITFSIATRE